jgi:hypothetical protein
MWCDRKKDEQKDCNTPGRRVGCCPGRELRQEGKCARGEGGRRAGRRHRRRPGRQLPADGFRDEKNALVGFDIDLAREAGKRLGAEVTFKPIDWNAKEAELTGKRVDVLWNGLTITEPRKEKILFTTPYLENRQIIVVTDKSPVKAKADLAGKVVGVQDGSSAIDAIEKDAATAKSLKELKKFGDNVTALMDLSRRPARRAGRRRGRRSLLHDQEAGRIPRPRRKLRHRRLRRRHAQGRHRTDGAGCRRRSTR